MNQVYELYGSKSWTKDAVKEYLQSAFGFTFTGRSNDDSGDYWMYANGDMEIVVQDNIDLGDNVPRNEEYRDYPVLVYLSQFNTGDPSSAEFVQKLKSNSIELLVRTRWEGRDRTVLYGSGIM